MRIPQSDERLRAHLDEQLRFLRSSAAAYDAGESIEAKRLAVTIRLLVHDTDKSHSLLGQLNLKRIAFVDGGDVPVPVNLMSTAGLIGIHFGPWGIRYIPKFALPPGRQAPTLRNFVDWWRRPVIVDDQKAEINRESLVLAMANTDGGAHVDPSIERTYARLSRQNSLGWSMVQGPKIETFGGIEYASVRQIAWELEQSITRRQHIALAPVALKNIGRNDPCPCGSGLKLRKCHGTEA